MGNRKRFPCEPKDVSTTWVWEKVKDDTHSRFLPANIRKIAALVPVSTRFSAAKLIAARLLRKRSVACGIEVTKIQGQGSCQAVLSALGQQLCYPLQCPYTIFIAKKKLLLNLL